MVNWNCCNEKYLDNFGIGLGGWILKPTSRISSLWIHNPDSMVGFVTKSICVTKILWLGGTFIIATNWWIIFTKISIIWLFMSLQLLSFLPVYKFTCYFWICFQLDEFSLSYMRWVSLNGLLSWLQFHKIYLSLEVVLNSTLECMYGELGMLDIRVI